MKLSAFGVFRMFMKKSKSKVVKLDDALKVVENFLNRMLLANLQMLKDENEIE
jgi:hypothetical protein